MWDILFSNLPMVILIIIALFFCTIEVVKGVQFFKELKNKKVNEVVEERQQAIDIQAEFNKLHERFDDIQDELKIVKERLATAEQQLKDLTISDMHDIKSWIVEQYHKFYVQQGWIDAFSAETIDRRYSDYKINCFLSSRFVLFNFINMAQNKKQNKIN